MKLLTQLLVIASLFCSATMAEPVPPESNFMASCADAQLQYYEPSIGSVASTIQLWANCTDAAGGIEAFIDLNLCFANINGVVLLGYG
jgi:hypothetical protein